MTVKPETKDDAKKSSAVARLKPIEQHWTLPSNTGFLMAAGVLEDGSVRTDHTRAIPAPRDRD